MKNLGVKMIHKKPRNTTKIFPTGNIFFVNKERYNIILKYV